nr:hypothetical protein [Streptomyces sp. TRM49041]
MEAGPRAHDEPQTTLQHAPTQDESARPGAVTGAREHGGGQACDLVTVPARQGLEAVDILRRGGAPAVGPVLHDDVGDTLGFLVPPGTAAAWDVPGSACTRTEGRGLRVPAEVTTPTAPPEPPPVGSDWLLPPVDTDPVTDPVILREALDEAARLIRAADNCR